MSFINSRKTFAVKSELDVFSSKPTQNCVHSGYFQEHRPISVLESEGPIEFFITETDDYIDLAHTKINLRVKITREDGVPMKPEDPVSLCNNFADTLIDHLSMDLNGRSITTPSNLYNYRSYIENVLNYSDSAKSTHLAAGLYIDDEAEKFDDSTSSGFKARKAFLKNGCLELSSYIHSELMSQDKFLVNGVSMRLKFYRSKVGFCLMTTETDVNKYKIDITEAVLVVRKVRINPSVMVAHERALLKSNIKLNINRIDLKSITLSSGTISKSLDNIFIGQMPKRIIMGMVTSKAFNGSITTNPYNFQSFNHSNILLSTDSDTHIQPIKSNFEKGDYLQAYLSLFTASGICFSDNGNAITRKNYPHGNALVAFDLTEDLSASESHLGLPRQGSLRIDLTFAKAIEEAVSIILYAEFDNLIEVR